MDWCGYDHCRLRRLRASSGGSGVFGLRLAAAACLEERRLSQIMQLLRRMQSQLQYQLTPLPELCSQCGRDVGGPVGRVLQSLGKELESRMYPDVYSCMRAALQADQELSPACRRLLVQLGRELGRFDLAGCGGCKVSCNTS